MRFDELSLDPRLLRAIADRGYTETTDVQTRTLAKPSPAVTRPSSPRRARERPRPFW